MKIALLADIHVENHRRHGGELVAGVNNRCRLTLDALRVAIGVAEAERVDALVVLGDLFDTDRPSPQVVAAVMRALDARREGLRVIVVAGNHDLRTDAAGDHALAPLYPVVEVVDAPSVVSLGRFDLLLLPYLAGKSADEIPAALERFRKTATSPAILCIHAGIADESTPHYLRDAHDAIHVAALQRAAGACGISHVFAGNWHTPRIWPGQPDRRFPNFAPQVVQVGALVPTGWDNPGMGYGIVAIFDAITEQVETRTVPGPRFLSATSAAEVRAIAEASRAAGCEAFVRLTVPPADFETTRFTYRTLPLPGVAVVEVIADAEGRKEEAANAAQAARERVDLAEASAAYVANMPLDEGVDREAVARMVIGYLGSVS